MKISQNNNLVILSSNCERLPQVVFSLLDIMREISVINLLETKSNLEVWAEKISKFPTGTVLPKKVLGDLSSSLQGCKLPKGWIDAEVRLMELTPYADADYWVNVEKRIRQHFEGQTVPLQKHKTKDDFYRIDQLLAAAISERGVPKTKEMIHKAIFELVAAIDDELRKRKFVMLDADESKLFNSKTAWLNRIAKKLPPVKKDLVLVGNCLAMNFHTAAVFHSIRAAEIGMRELGIKLQAEPKREGQPISIPDATWAELLKAINDRIDSESKLSKAQRNIIKTGIRDFRLLVQHLDILKDTRNHVMHSHDFYNKSEAKGISDRVKQFLQKLVEKI